MEISEQDVEELIVNIWTILVQPELEPAKFEDLESELSEVLFTSLVHLTGDVGGTVVVECYGSLASRVASAMFGMAKQELDDEEVRDALAELANMLGGNIKGMFPKNCQLSLPAVIVGEHYSLQLPQTEVVHRLSYRSDGLPIRFTLLRRPGASESSDLSAA